jgi:hypothetical protein
MNCQFCGSEIPAKSTKCPRCGANQNLDAAIPPPSPYYNEVIPPTPPEVVAPEMVVPPVPPPDPITPRSFIPPASLKTDRSMLALISLILGIVGIPFAFMLAGCSLPLNAIGIFLAWMGLKSERRGMAIIAMVLNIGTIIAVIIFFFVFAGLLAYGIFQGN